jgi:outer membrane protein assembly factor BamB
VWTFDSDWVAPGSQHDFWEPVYHAVLANGFLYDPGAGGTIFKINRTDGSVVSRINPFDAIDANTFTASPLSTDAGGNIYYNVVRLTGNSPSFYSHDAVNSWLIKVGPDDSVAKRDYTALLRQATIIGDPVPSANADCKVSFRSTQLPWPPSPEAVPSTTTCGGQRAALNVAPAIAPDGTIYTVSRGHFVTRYNYLIAVNPDLTGKWASSLRGHLNDGCNDGTVAGSVLPVNGQPGGCRVGSRNGVDPGTNEPGPGRVLDDASSTPTVAPDGTILFGAYTRYNYAQGHLMQFSAAGLFLNAFNFGWDSTPAIYPNGGSYSIVVKNNHYSGLGSYCNNAAVCPTDRTATNPASPEAYFVSQLFPDLTLQWSFQNTNKDSCARNADGSVSCTPNTHPNSFEWCVNAPVVDANGVVYANSEDGFLYAINQGGTKKQGIFQQLNLGAAYTPASLGPDGKIYSQNAGHMFVVGQ